MRRYRRGPRRQGVVYGPPRQYGDGDDSFVGRLLGPIVIIGAFALLAAGAWAFIGRGGPPDASPTPTRGGLVSPSPSPSPTLSPTPTATASPTATPTLPPSPSPSPTELTIEVREGPGSIQFGNTYNENTLRITDPRVTFGPRGRFVWSAQLTEAANTDELYITINEYDPATGTETLVNEQTWEVRNPDAVIFLRRQRMQRLVDGPGIYVVRYFRDDILLAEGYFRVE